MLGKARNPARKDHPVMPTSEEILLAFRQLSAADRAELCGLDMPLHRQLRNKSLWLAFVRNQATRKWSKLDQLRADAITPKEAAWCRLLEIAGAPTSKQPGGARDFDPSDNRRRGWA